MAFSALFDKYDLIGSGVTTVKEDWYTITTVTSGKKLCVGFASFTSWDKALMFELRSNKPGQSAGTLAATDRIDSIGIAAGSGGLMDIFKGGTVAQKTVPNNSLSTGVEKLWLRVVGINNAAGAFDYQLDYAELTE